MTEIKKRFNLANYSVFAIEKSFNKKLHIALNGEYHGLNCGEYINEGPIMEQQGAGDAAPVVCSFEITFTLTWKRQ